MIKNMKIRFNLNNENDRKAYDYLHSAEKSYSNIPTEEELISAMEEMRDKPLKSA